MEGVKFTLWGLTDSWMAGSKRDWRKNESRSAAGIVTICMSETYSNIIEPDFTHIHPINVNKMVIYK